MLIILAIFYSLIFLLIYAGQDYFKKRKIVRINRVKATIQYRDCKGKFVDFMTPSQLQRNIKKEVV